MSAAFTTAEVTRALGVAPLHLSDPEVVFPRVTIDSRRIAPGDLFVALGGERYDGEAFRAAAVSAGAAGVIGSAEPFAGGEGVARWVVPEGRAALQALAAFHRRRLDTRVVAVTGSNGKTTTKELIAAVLGQAFPTARTPGNLNNQIGVPLTLLEIGPQHAWAVVELGMNLPGEIAPLAAITRPAIGVITNIAASHLTGLGSVEAVLEEKLALGRALGPADLLIFCGDQPRLAAAARQLPCRSLAYGLEPGNDVLPDTWSLDEDGRGRFTLDRRTFRLRLTGRHNIVNALAAVAVGREAGLAPGTIAVGLAEPDALPLRMQLERWGEVVALVDCYNANPESVLSAAATLSTLSGVRRRVAVLGTMLELGEQSQTLHADVGRALHGLVELVVAVGSAASPIADGAGAAGVASMRFDDPGAATAWLIDNLEPGDGVLFKASRGAALETVVAPVRAACVEGSARCGAAPQHPWGGVDG
ncbi:MAG: UDP-N-acetylmuramoyl-tripeptide--D-alanyl-D-alanine ligase [Gemmatimonadota bacterium]